MAYAILLERFMWSRFDLADHLRVSLATLVARIKRAIACWEVQPTLFDGVDRIDPSFVARQGKAITVEKRSAQVNQQALWN